MTTDPAPQHPETAPSEVPTIVVGLAPHQSEAVVTTAARLARELRAHLVCAWVDPAQMTVTTGADGAVVTVPLDPDAADDDPDSTGAADDALAAELHRVLDVHGVSWEMRTLAGAPAREIAQLADEVAAALIVVGTRQKGLRESVREFVSGSVAVQLAHRQHRPLVVVPLDPVGLDDVLPWDTDD
ncbi:universal stress protein [Brachybacterium sp. ACRRE]|uniref:universal stress protein n=1 Tax=Brachybacterium sp. ACRRE TaxID=2918184 RepID=UPI001EF1FE07|nr:universal stress protein [Brachybacterium sp. ACRRE]MCG7308102.1 universal stress protein [Brachybacterium sp. ACRRE]